MLRLRSTLAFLSLFAAASPFALAQSPGAPIRTPNLETNIERPLRYRPEGTDFVIENGAESFNRPLYGGGTAFRVDGGDKPLFGFYLPGRGGVLRLGWKNANGSGWLDECKQVVARYRTGTMVYEISDPALGQTRLTVQAAPLFKTEGLALRIERAGGAEPLEIVWALGGSDGQLGNRDVDIGTENVPVRLWWSFSPALCADNKVDLTGGGFLLRGKKGDLFALGSNGSAAAAGEAETWNTLSALLDSPKQGTPKLPVGLAHSALRSGEPLYVAVQRLSRASDDRSELSTYLEVRKDNGAEGKTAGFDLAPAFRADMLPDVFADAERRCREELAGKVSANTPDAYLNAAVAALAIAGDGVWDDPTGTVMHGAVAWRSKLLGWRGPYLNDALGRHDRARSHILYWAGRQNTEPVPDKLPPSDASANLSRSEAALHSNGDLSNSHYDMNLVYIDAVFRHLLWTGDLNLARRLWPMIERHLAWERRLFRRAYGPEGLPLYEGYCCIWASDDVAYSGGGATHSSAYNYYHNKFAARLARLLEVDATPYEKEAEAILRGMRRELWLSDRGWYAEWRDWLGKREAHPSPALWSFYHSVDSEVTSPFEAWQMTRFIDTQLAHFPLRGPGVPDGGYFTLPTTDWMPYTWSTNNVVMSEVAHTALGYWQTGRQEEAWKLYKGAILDSMFMGLCPGNAGMCTAFDVARREAQRDFADSVGMMSRALVEGLFGVHPDGLAGEVLAKPGFPASWDRAALSHPDFDFSFERRQLTETYRFLSRFGRPLTLRLQVPVVHAEIEKVEVDGKGVAWTWLQDSIGQPRIEIVAPPAETHEVRIFAKGESLALGSALESRLVLGEQSRLAFAPASLLEVFDPQAALAPVKNDDGTLSIKAVGRPGHRTAFVKLRQGQAVWWRALQVELTPALVVEDRPAAPGAFRFELLNASRAPFSGTARLAQTPSGSTQLSLEAGKRFVFEIPTDHCLPGTQQLVLESADRTQTLNAKVANWLVTHAPEGTRFETVPLGGFFNDQVSRIFKNEYLSPRSPFCSLAIPKQGIGSWCRPNATAEIDDSGLRKAAATGKGVFTLPNGIPFATPGGADDKNIAFTSLWDNYPAELSVPLSGKARHLYLLMAGSSNSMQSRFENGEVVATYADGTSERLALENPTTWWPIEEDYFTDDYAFSRPGSIPPRVDLKTGAVRICSPEDFKGKGGRVRGGAATVLDLPLQPGKELRSLSVRTLANEVVVGLMAATLVR